MGKLIAARAARRLALAAALAVLLAAAAELALRATPLGPPFWYRPDPLLGWTLRPYAGSHGGGPWGQINAYGQRDNAHELDKRPGVYRIAVLGDERSEALDVRLRETWWHRLPGELDRCGFAAGKKIEVLNFGVAGYSTAQEALVLESDVMRYRPDLVLLQFSGGEDVRENSRALATRLDRPFFSLDEHGALRFDGSFSEARDFNERSQFRHELARELSDHSRLLRVLGRIGLAGRAQAKAGSPEAGPGDARREEARRITAALLARMREFSERNGARFVAVRPTTTQRSAADGPWTVADHLAAARDVAAGLCSAAGSRTSPGAR